VNKFGKVLILGGSAPPLFKELIMYYNKEDLFEACKKSAAESWARDSRPTDDSRTTDSEK